MRLIMFGTGPFAVPVFQALLESEHQVLALITRPIIDSGKRRKSSENPARDAGERAGIEILDPPDVNAMESVNVLSQMKADLFVVCDYGQILSSDCLNAARLGGINLHGSLLPKYRGAAPINWAIYQGETKTGITVIQMSPRLDAGPSLVREEMKIQADHTAEDIEPLLAELGVQPVLQALQMLQEWDGTSLLGERQLRKLATKAPRLKKTDGLIDWNRTAKQIVNQIRAFQPWPGTYSNWQSGGKNPMRIIIHRAQAIATCPGGFQPGQVCISDKDQLVICTSDGGLSLTTVQPAGKKPMNIVDFLRGNRIQIGDRFR